MVLSDPAKSGLEDGAWIDGYQNKAKTISNTKNKSPLFFRTVYHSNTMWFPTMLLLPSWTSSWIFNNAENNMSVKFSKYNRCWKLSENSY